jgi:hypothetical protein
MDSHIMITTATETIRMCSLCGIEKPLIDFSKSGKRWHRKIISSSIYQWLQKQGWPKAAYRLQCANCNCSIKANNWSPKGADS